MRANGTAHALPSKDLVKEINALKAQLKKLSAWPWRPTPHDGVSRAVGAIEAKSKEAIDGAIEAAQDFIDEYADSAKDDRRGAGQEVGADARQRRRLAGRDRAGPPVRHPGRGDRHRLPCGYLCRRS